MDLTNSQAHCMLKHLSAQINFGESLQKLNNELLSSISEEEEVQEEVQKRETLLRIMIKVSKTYCWLDETRFKLDEVEIEHLQDALRTHRSHIQNVIEEHYTFLKEHAKGALDNLLIGMFNLQQADDPHTLSELAKRLRENEEDLKWWLGEEASTYS